LIGDLRGHVHQTDENIDEIMRVRQQAGYEFRVVIGSKLLELLIEQPYHFMRIPLKPLQRVLEIGRVDPSLASEALLHLPGGDDSGRDFLVEQLRGLLYDLRGRCIDLRESLLLA
jgi:hypothetical protein